MLKNPLFLATLLGGLSIAWAADHPTMDYETVISDIDAAIGKNVEWFGYVEKVISFPDGGMQISVTEVPPGKSGVPVLYKYGEGRFIIKIPVPLDTQYYHGGSLVHATGVVSGAQTRLIGTDETTMPVVSATRMCLWERKIPEAPYHCVIGAARSAETDAVQNQGNYAVTCDQDGYYWTQSKVCDFVPDKSMSSAGGVNLR